MYSWRKDSEWWGLGALATPPANVQAALSAASASSGVPFSLLQALAFQESSYNPLAVSSAGAQGLLQLMPATGASLGVTNPFDVQQNANAGAKYLAQLYAQYGDWNTALVAYNEGPGNLASQGPFASSQSYADAILANAGLSPADTSSVDSVSTDASTVGSGFDFSSVSSALDSAVSSGLSPLAWAGIAAAALGVLWAIA